MKRYIVVYILFWILSVGGPGVKTAVKRSLRMTDVFPSPEPKNLAEITNKPTTVSAF